MERATFLLFSGSKPRTHHLIQHQLGAGLTVGEFGSFASRFIQHLEKKVLDLL
jgi:hypothetical protein